MTNCERAISLQLFFLSFSLGRFLEGRPIFSTFDPCPTLFLKPVFLVGMLFEVSFPNLSLCRVFPKFHIYLLLMLRGSLALSSTRGASDPPSNIISISRLVYVQEPDSPDIIRVIKNLSTVNGIRYNLCAEGIN